MRILKLIFSYLNVVTVYKDGGSGAQMAAFIGLILSALLAGIAFISWGLSSTGIRVFMVTNLVWIVPTIIVNTKRIAKYHD